MPGLSYLSLRNVERGQRDYKVQRYQYDALKPLQEISKCFV